MTASALDARIAGPFGHRFRSELARNSAQFPLANILLEALQEGWRILLAPDLYVLVVAALVQAWFITRREGRPLARLVGNLAGPAVYTVVEAAIEGPAFFGAPNHVAYWAFGAAIGMLQWGQAIALPRPAAFMLVAESVVRACILFVMYGIFEVLTAAEPFTWRGFLADPSHVFIALATLILGVSAGLESRVARDYLALLRTTSAQLRRYSEWLLGAELLERVIADPAALTLARRERSVLFMDIRGFTAWSERRAPEVVVQALNEYYAAAEPVLRGHGAIKVKLSADEVLAVFTTARAAVECAQALRERAAGALARHGLAAGIGIHAGPVVEGLLGSEGVQAYDVVGDTVNTAKRIESAAAGGEVLASGALLALVEPTPDLGPPRAVVAKGKQEPIEVHPVLAAAEGPVAAAPRSAAVAPEA